MGEELWSNFCDHADGHVDVPKGNDNSLNLPGGVDDDDSFDKSFITTNLTMRFVKYVMEVLNKLGQLLC